VAVTAEDATLFPLPSFLASKNFLYQILLITDKTSFFLASLLPTFILLPSFIPSVLHSLLPSFLPYFLSSLLSGFIFLDANLLF